MTSAVRFGRLLCSVMALVVCGTARASVRAGRRSPRHGAAAEGPDRLCRAGLDAPDRQGAGWHAAGPRRRRGASEWARILGRTVEFHWCASAECAWHCLPEGRCDVVVGQPQDSGPPRDVAWSVPYAGAQFGLVVPRDSQGVRSLADLRGKRVGIVAGTVALSEKDHRSSGSSRARSCSTASRPRRWTPRSSTPTSPPGTCTSIRSSACGS